MPTISTCPSCDKKLKTPDGAEGRKLRCPGCSAALLITEDGLVPAEATPKPSKSRSGPRQEEEDEKPRRGRRRDEDEDEEEERPRRARKGGGIPLWVWLTGGGVLGAGLLILIFVLVLGGGGNKFDKIKEGMTDKEVTSLLGEPTTGDTKLVGVWYYPPLKKDDLSNFEKLGRVKEVMTINFKDGKVKSINRIKASDMKNMMK